MLKQYEIQMCMNVSPEKQMANEKAGTCVIDMCRSLSHMWSV